MYLVYLAIHLLMVIFASTLLLRGLIQKHFFTNILPSVLLVTADLLYTVLLLILTSGI